MTRHKLSRKVLMMVASPSTSPHFEPPDDFLLKSPNLEVFRPIWLFCHIIQMLIVISFMNFRKLKWNIFQTAHKGKWDTNAVWAHLSLKSDVYVFEGYLNVVWWFLSYCAVVCPASGLLYFKKATPWSPGRLNRVTAPSTGWKWQLTIEKNDLLYIILWVWVYTWDRVSASFCPH